MHPTIGNEITKVRIAELHRRADKARLSHAAKQGRRVLRQRGRDRLLPGLRPWTILHRTT